MEIHVLSTYRKLELVLDTFTHYKRGEKAITTM